jgi:hypothetical protein
MTPTRNEVHEIFRSIEATSGVVMRGHFLCCQSCAHAQLADKEHIDDYGFYHVQSTDSAAYDGWLYIGHGLDEVAPRAIVKAFRAAGCEVEWENEDVNKTIRVKVDKASFDLSDPRNIPQDAEQISHEGATTYVWRDAYSTDDATAWQVRVVSDGNAWWHAECGSREEALASAEHAVQEWLDEDTDA